jgi:hypothetical protein
MIKKPLVSLGGLVTDFPLDLFDGICYHFSHLFLG